MNDRVLIGMTILFGVALFANVLVHWFVVCRQLYGWRDRFLAAILPWRFFGDMGRYKELCRSRGNSLSHYYIILLGLWFTLLLGLIVGVCWFYRLQNPMD